MRTEHLPACQHTPTHTDQTHAHIVVTAHSPPTRSLTCGGGFGVDGAVPRTNLVAVPPLMYHTEPVPFEAYVDYPVSRGLQQLQSLWRISTAAVS